MTTREQHKEEAETIGQRLKVARIRAALTQEQLAERSGLSPFSLSRIESGHNVPRPSTLRKVARALGSEARSLLTGEPPGGDAASSKCMEPRLAARLAAPEMYPFHTTSTQELMNTITVLSQKLPDAVYRAKTLSGAERQKSEREARGAFGTLTAAFFEMQSRSPDSNLFLYEPEPGGSYSMRMPMAGMAGKKGSADRSADPS